MHNIGIKMYGLIRTSGPASLADVGNVKNFLTQLAKEIGMNELGTVVYDVPISVRRLGQEPLNDEGGVTGVVVFTTSHAAIHTWPEDCAARFDIDSCRFFDPDTVTRVIREFFDIDDLQYQEASWESFTPTCSN